MKFLPRSIPKQNRLVAEQRPEENNEYKNVGPTPIAPRQVGAALGVSSFVLAATTGGFRVGLLLMIAVSAGAFACILALPAHSLHDAHDVAASR